MNINWRDLYNRAYDWVLTYGPGILLAAVVFIIGIWVIRLLNRGIKKSMERRKVNPSVRYFLQNFFSITLQILLIILVLQIAGFELTLFSAIVAGLTVAIGLALSGTLQNFVSGILILWLKPYKVGDNVIAQDQEGTVSSIQLFYTVVTTFDNRTVVIPNGQLSNSVMVNLSREGTRRLDIDLKFGYGTDIKHVRSILLKAMEASTDLFPAPAPRVGISFLDYDRYTITINVWTKAHGFYDTRLAVNERIVEALEQAGIKLPGQ